MRLLLAFLALTLSAASPAATSTDTAFVDTIADVAGVTLDVSLAQSKPGAGNLRRQPGR